MKAQAAQAHEDEAFDEQIREHIALLEELGLAAIALMACYLPARSRPSWA